MGIFMTILWVVIGVGLILFLWYEVMSFFGFLANIFRQDKVEFHQHNYFEKHPDPTRPGPEDIEDVNFRRAK